MQKARLSLEKIYELVQTYWEENTDRNPRVRGRPRQYDDILIVSLWLYQTLWGTSYRETLAVAHNAGYAVPALSTYHYRVGALP